MREPLRNHGDRGGATAVYAVQAPQCQRASGVSGVLGKLVGIFATSYYMDTELYEVYSP